MAPEASGIGEAVQQHHGRALAGDLVVDLRPGILGCRHLFILSLK